MQWCAGSATVAGVGLALGDGVALALGAAFGVPADWPASRKPPTPMPTAATAATVTMVIWRVRLSRLTCRAARRR